MGSPAAGFLRAPPRVEVSVAFALVALGVLAAPVAPAAADGDGDSDRLSEVRREVFREVRRPKMPRVVLPLDESTGSRSAASQSAPAAAPSRYVPGEAVIESRSGATRTVSARRGESTRDLILRLARSRDVRFVQPNYLYRYRFLPNDPLFSSGRSPQRDYLDEIRITSAWNASLGSGAVTAVIDSGAATDHPDVAANLLRGENVIFGSPEDGTSNVTDEVGHGTAVASTVAAVADNGIGLAGTAPSSKVIPIKAGTASGLTTTDIVAALKAARKRKPSVVNMSFGGPGTDPASERQLARLYDRGDGAVIVAAAGESQDGNPGDSRPEHPAAWLDLEGAGLSVTATDANGQRARFADFGPYISLAAPGQGMDVAVPIGEPESDEQMMRPSGYSIADGTSFAAPIVSGVAALVRSRDPSLKASDVLNILRYTARSEREKGGRSAELGWGIVNARRALGEIGDPPAITSRAKLEAQRGKTKTVRFRAADPNSDFVRAKLQIRRRGSFRAIATGVFRSGEESRLRWAAPDHSGEYDFRLVARNWANLRATAQGEIEVR